MSIKKTVLLKVLFSKLTVELVNRVFMFSFKLLKISLPAVKHSFNRGQKVVIAKKKSGSQNEHMWHPSIKKMNQTYLRNTSNTNLHLLGLIPTY